MFVREFSPKKTKQPEADFGNVADYDNGYGDYGDGAESEDDRAREEGRGGGDGGQDPIKCVKNSIGRTHCRHRQASDRIPGQFVVKGE